MRKRIKPYYEDTYIQIFNKDCRSMPELPDESVQVVVTSPPYYGLREYSGDQELIWGDNHCEHQWDMPTSAILGFNTLFRPEGEISTPLGLPSNKGKYAETVKGGADRQQKRIVGNLCSLCGAWKGQLGLEPTMELYIRHCIEILREIRRVLRKDGVVFWNIGDSYATHASGGKGYAHNFRPPEVVEKEGIDQPKPSAKSIGLKEKDLCLIPFRLAIAAQEDGWWVRSVIIWAKPNPMPESVNGWRWERHKVLMWPDGTLYKKEKGKLRPRGVKWRDCPGCPKCLPNDGYVLRKGSWRPTESHEYLLMLTKTGEYYGDIDAVREPYTEPLNRWGGPALKSDTSKTAAYKEMQKIGYSSAFRVGPPMRPDPSGRNIRSVWAFPTVPYPGAHFAVFPEKLPELCIKVATPEVGCCAKCGAPWVRVTKIKGHQVTEAMRVAGCDKQGMYHDTETKDYSSAEAQKPSEAKQRILESMSQIKETLGWRPTCSCNASRVPSLVLDPLMGSGTTPSVAKNLNRFACGYELSEEYCQLAVERCRQQVLG